jgi:hypothetical protein
MKKGAGEDRWEENCLDVVDAFVGLKYRQPELKKDII